MDTKAVKLRRMLESDRLIIVAGAHDALSARLAERHAFDAIWASGLGISAVHGVPDASILTMSELLAATGFINDVSCLPVIADCDSGFGNIHNTVRMVQKYEQAGIAGVCIEDKTYPKINSFAAGPQALVPVRDFCAKIHAAKTTHQDPDFTVIARVEALIAGLGQKEARRRAAAYVQAGADAVLIHSRRKDVKEIEEFAADWTTEVPLMVVPTRYPAVTHAELHRLGIRVVIYANQALRASLRAMDETFRHIGDHGSTRAIENAIATVKEVFELQQVPAMEELERRIYGVIERQTAGKV